MPNYPTQQQKNGFKLQLYRDKCEEYQRKAFHKKFSTNPKILFTELKKYDKHFKDLLQRRILRKEQYELLFPACGETDSNQFDSTLLATLLRDLCGYDEPSTGWNAEPDTEDLTEIADLIRLKKGRNGIQHKTLDVDTLKH